MWASSLRRRQESPISIPWDIGITPLRGNLVTVMGAPGVGKSLFGLNWCLNVPELSVLVSLDTDMPTQALRACSILTGASNTDVLENPDGWARLLERRNLRCRMYDITMTVKDINDLVLAETEYWGRAPGLVVVDNVSNMVTEMSYEQFRSAFIGLQKVARLRGTVVVALHHVTRGYSSGRLSLHSGSFAGEQESEVVLGLWRSDLGNLEVGILKNRNGMADPSGQISYPLTLNHENFRMEEGYGNLWKPAEQHSVLPQPAPPQRQEESDQEGNLGTTFRLVRTHDGDERGSKSGGEDGRYVRAPATGDDEDVQDSERAD